MFIQVRLLKGYSQPLLYAIPPEWANQKLVGSLVRVPFRATTKPAIVIEQLAERPASANYTIKTALGFEQFPADKQYHSFIEQLATYYQIEPLHCIKRIQQFLTEKEAPETEIAAENIPATQEVLLTDEQQEAVNFVIPHIEQSIYMPTVLHGVTGSGKTEVYKKLITSALYAHKTAVLLLPEVTLALRFETVLRAQLPHIPIFSFHSGTSVKNKRLLWQTLLNEQPCLIIGVHLPMLLPIVNLGLIIIDEEHEIGYQEKKHPKINSKEAALLRAKLHNIPIVLGSATPSLATIHNIKTKGWRLFELKKRFAGAFPQVKVVQLKDHKQRRNFWISKPLEDAIKDRLHKKEQTIIFINRRGFSFFVQCKECSYVFACKNCSVSLTLHSNNQLLCHYCGVSNVLARSCPQCKKDESNFIKKGIGTQQVVSILEKLFPFARIARADLDTTTQKKVWQKIMHDFQHGMLDILVGTQTITKGFHFPNVTLVGILWADLNLNFPMYNAAETTLQQLIQVAGRAGRARLDSQVIVQSMVDHPIFQFLNEQDYLRFYTYEIESRQLMGYPPFARFVEIELKHTDERTIEAEAMKIMEHLFTVRTKNNLSMQILGPAKPPVFKVKNIESRKIYIKGESIQQIIRLYQTINHNNYTSHIYFTPNPGS